MQRLVRARSRDEKAAVETVLDEFFQQGADGWRHKRCDEEIAKYQEKRAKAKRSAEARWSASDRAAGGNAEAMRTHSEGNANASETHDGRNAHQSPDTKHQSKAKADSKRADSSSVARAQPPAQPSATEATAAGRACLAMRRGGLAQANPAHPDLRAAIAEGADDEAWEHTAREAAANGKGFAWVVATVRGRIRDAANRPTGANHAPTHAGYRPSLAERVAAANRVHDERELAASR